MDHPFLDAAGGIFLALFPIVDPIGVLPSFLGLTAGCSRAQRRTIARNAALCSVGILVFFLFAGRLVLHHFGISLGALQVAGGIIVGITGIRMIVETRPHKVEAQSDEAQTERGPPEVAFSPLTIPLLAGPGAIGTVIAVHAREHGTLSQPGFVVGILAIGLVIYACLALGVQFSGHLRPGWLDALTRIMGLIVLAIAVELVLHGLVEHFKERHPNVGKTPAAAIR